MYHTCTEHFINQVAKIDVVHLLQQNKNNTTIGTCSYYLVGNFMFHRVPCTCVVCSTWFSESLISCEIFKSLDSGRIVRVSLASRLFSVSGRLSSSWMSSLFVFLSSLVCGVYLMAAARRVQISDCLEIIMILHP